MRAETSPTYDPGLYQVQCGMGLWSYQWGRLVDDCMGLCSGCPYGSAVRESPMGPVGPWYYDLYLMIDTTDMSPWTMTSTEFSKCGEIPPNQFGRGG